MSKFNGREICLVGIQIIVALTGKLPNKFMILWLYNRAPPWNKEAPSKLIVPNQPIFCTKFHVYLPLRKMKFPPMIATFQRGNDRASRRNSNNSNQIIINGAERQRWRPPTKTSEHRISTDTLRPIVSSSQQRYEEFGSNIKKLKSFHCKKIAKWVVVKDIVRKFFIGGSLFAIRWKASPTSPPLQGAL